MRAAASATTRPAKLERSPRTAGQREGVEAAQACPLDSRKEPRLLSLLSSIERNDVGKARGDLLQGTLDMLVLKALQLEPMHGWGITERIEQWSESVLQLGQGTLYPALYRLERQGLIRSEWNVTENNRRARYYSLTREGRRHFSDELVQWRRMSRAVNLVLEATMNSGDAS
jgi:PadR family transcriptional regulator, regulatory protein PadR